MYSSTATVLAASRTGDIAVMDLHLDMPRSIVDNTDVEVGGTISIFENHGTPLKAGELDIHLIRTGKASLTNKEIQKFHRRGSGSLAFPKKNYSLDLKEAAPVLGMPAEEEWVMHSCWADKTCLRNLIGYWQAAQLFAWAPRTEFAEVFINDEYRGLYLIVEKVRLGPDRVNLPPPTDDALWWVLPTLRNIGVGIVPTPTARLWRPAGISGTYILKRDGNDGDFDWTSTVDPDLRWWFVSPKKNLTEWQKDYIQNHMSVDFEPSFHPASANYAPWQYSKLVDERSAADFVIIQEIANNVDAYWKSMHITKHRASWNMPFNPGLIHMGPIWDLDLAFANANFEAKTCRTDNWRIETGGSFEPLREMWRVPAFRRALRDRWNFLRYNAIVSRTAIDGKLTDTANRIAAARARDNKTFDTIGKMTWSECAVQPTYLDEVAELKRWIRTRIDWMDSRILNDPEFLNPKQ
jgi:hypothetical protein